MDARAVNTSTRSVSPYYLDGVREGRKIFESEGLTHAQAHLANLRKTIQGFPASSPVGQVLRGERDFWLNQLKADGRLRVRA